MTEIETSVLEKRGGKSDKFEEDVEPLIKFQRDKLNR